MKRKLSNLFREILKGTYFDRGRSSGVALFLLVGNSVLVTTLMGMVILLFVGPIVFIVSLLFLGIGLPNIASRIANLAFIIPVIGGLASCMGWGAEKGVESFKDYLGLPFDELERTLNNLSLEKRGKLEQKIRSYIYKCINECIDEIEN